ncbi:hypothetical protein [Leifsonia sp. 71-9]|mgnify:CR=1 FL=1|uniref:hypothetical protein n=1 Tax=Leifsonia sp. 71-9 TaxID=1895934 RepID=UPI000928378A|nr:hypothetical protein [Leifsonia sp. 71-9]OJX72826.1 MAG: hypothetical protein BGO91_13740 [Leifsonia sp. 71-9]
MTNPAIIQDVIERFERPLTDTEKTAGAKWLDDAWSIVRRNVPGIQARMSLNPDQPGYIESEDVVRVLSWMVIRVLRNPEALRQWSDDTYNQTVDTAMSSGLLYLADSELADLLPAAPGAAANGMYSIPLGR